MEKFCLQDLEENSVVKISKISPEMFFEPERKPQLAFSNLKRFCQLCISGQNLCQRFEQVGQINLKRLSSGIREALLKIEAPGTEKKIKSADLNMMKQSCQLLLKLFVSYEALDDVDYDGDYQQFKKTALNAFFEEENRFYRNIDYSYHKIIHKNGHKEDSKFHFNPPSISYMPVFQQIFKLFGGDCSGAYIYPEAISEKLKNINCLEIGCGPGFGLKILQTCMKDAIGIDTLKFKEQPKDVNIVYDDIFNTDKNFRHKNTNLSAKEFNLIFSLDVMDNEVLFDNNKDGNSVEKAFKIIQIAHQHLVRDGIQLHMVPYRKLSGRVVFLNRLLNFFRENYTKINLKKFDTLKKDLDKEEARLRKLAINPKHNDHLNEFAKILGAEILKNEIVNSFWILALKKT